MRTTTLRILLMREYHTPTYVQSKLTSPGISLNVLEQPWFGNNTPIEAIPLGKYRVIREDHTERSNAWLITNVKNRTLCYLGFNLVRRNIPTSITIVSIDKLSAEVQADNNLKTEKDIFNSLTKGLSSFIIEIDHKPLYQDYLQKYGYHSYQQEENKHD